MPTQTRPRIALFTHDSFGLGHVRRSLRITQSLVAQRPDASVLLISGSPALDMLKTLPPKCDYLKLPTIATSGTNGAKTMGLDLGIAELVTLRGELTRHAVSSFAPDVFVTDNFPLGARHELLPTLQALYNGSTQTVLGMRDILDPPEKVRAEWERQGIYDVLDRYYDRILVYGVPEVLDVADAYALPSEVRSKLHYCGYVSLDKAALGCVDGVKSELNCDGKLIVACVGGGGDGYPLLRTLIEALADLPDVHALVVTGELMTDQDRQHLEHMAQESRRIELRRYVHDLPRYMAAADAVVCMGGYNTLSEVLALGVRSIVLPRNWRSGEHSERRKSRLDKEQLCRAEALAHLGALSYVHPDEVTTQALAGALTATLDAGSFDVPGCLRLQGADEAARHILTLADRRG